MSSSDQKRTVLITGCSTGSLGAALALKFHEKGLRVLAATRDPSKTNELKEAGITDLLALDVLDQSSIDAAVKEVSSLTGGTLDILTNNAGGGHYMPFLDLDLNDAKSLFEINVWSYLAVTKAFIPLLLKGVHPDPAKGRQSMIVNNTSISSVLKTPYHSAYGASKAAIAAFTDAQRIELAPFGIKVINLKTGSTSSNFKENKTNQFTLPSGSLYEPIRQEVERVISGEVTEEYAEDRMGWAESVVGDLLKSEPPAQVWRGGSAGTIQVASVFTLGSSVGDDSFRKLGGLDKLEKIVRERDG